MMNEDIEENKKRFEEEKGKKPKKEKKGKKEKNEEITYVNQEKEKDDEISSEEINDDDFNSEQGDNSSDYDNDYDDKEKDKDIDLEEDESQDNQADTKIVNPLRKEKKTKGNDISNIKENEAINEEDNLSSDTDEENNKILGKKIKREKKQPRKTNEQILSKIIDPENSVLSDCSNEEDAYNSDEKAEIRAIAKKMLRKKERLKILNNTYNRYVFEDNDKVPKWFANEEKQHTIPNKPVTKAEVLAEKQYMKKFTDRMPKKVLEAKARKKHKLNKKLEKVKKKAEAIANQDEIAEFSKVKQIEKLYKRELARNKEKKKYIVSRSFTNNSGRDRRGVKHVDRRLKKDKRAEKAREKKGKKFKRRK